MSEVCMKANDCTEFDLGFKVIEVDTGKVVQTVFHDDDIGWVRWAIDVDGCLNKVWWSHHEYCHNGHGIHFDFIEREGKYIIEFANGRRVPY